MTVSLSQPILCVNFLLLDIRTGNSPEKNKFMIRQCKLRPARCQISVYTVYHSGISFYQSSPILTALLHVDLINIVSRHVPLSGHHDIAHFE